MPAASDAGQCHVGTSVVRDTIRKPAIKHLKLMESDSNTDDVGETASDELSRYKLDTKIWWWRWSTVVVENESASFSKISISG